jgi:nicotinamide phosphoribosyltransferase
MSLETSKTEMAEDFDFESLNREQKRVFNKSMKRLASFGFGSVDDILDRLLPLNVSFMNPLLATDVYKMGHMEQYKPGTTEVYSYLIARTDRQYKHTVFSALQYWLKAYFTRKLTPEMGEEFLENRKAILGSNSKEVERKMRALCKLGYFPIEIKAVKEGTVMPVRNVLMTMRNTLLEFEWVPGFLESLILKVWDAITTASCSFTYRQIVNAMYKRTVDDGLMFLQEFAVHDFGYRGSKSEEEAAITGGAHLLSFTGSDTVPAREWLIRNYKADRNSPFILSVPASEHSVMCSFGRGEEIDGFRNMLRLYPDGIVSIVSDTYDVYKVCSEFAKELKIQILSRPGDMSKVVFRPDSGDPEKIICGDPNALVGSREWKGVLRLLEEVFGSTANSKGFKQLNPKVGLIYGDGMYLNRYIRTLARLEKMGYAASNLVIGVGGILRNHSRDSMGFALKATHVINGGESVDIEKDPITDKKKKSHKGLMYLTRDTDGNYHTVDQCTTKEESGGLLEVVFRDGAMVREESFADIRARVQAAIEEYPIDMDNLITEANAELGL